MSNKRRADALAGKGSFLDALRARREAVESGEIDRAAEVYIKAIGNNAPPEGMTMEHSMEHPVSLKKK